MKLLPRISGLYKANKNQSGIFKLTELQEERFHDLMDFFECSAIAGKVRILYRGENLQNLRGKLGGDTSNPDDLSDLFKKCFFLGDKAKAYLLAGKCSKPSDAWDFNIGSACDEDFEYIYSEIVNLVNDDRAYIFSRVEDAFYNFFTNENKLQVFMSVVKNVHDPRERLLLRDYYLWILHNLGGETFKYASYFVSSTTDLTTAQTCAYNEGIGAEPILFLYFLPQPTEYFGLMLQDVTRLSTIAANLGLPYYTNQVYEEDETSLKGALFPHFILGIYEYATQRFIVNKHLFEDTNRSIVSIRKYGIKIDQECFNDFIKRTNLKGGVITDHSGTFESA